MNSAIEVDGAPSGSGESDEVMFREVDSEYFRTAGHSDRSGPRLHAGRNRAPGRRWCW